MFVRGPAVPPSAAPMYHSGASVSHCLKKLLTKSYWRPSLSDQAVAVGKPSVTHFARTHAHLEWKSLLDIAPRITSMSDATIDQVVVVVVVVIVIVAVVMIVQPPSAIRNE